MTHSVELYKILVVDDHPLVRAGVRGELERLEDYTIVGECNSAAPTLEAIDTLRPDLLILDVWLSGQNALDWIPRYSSLHPSMKILCFSASTFPPESEGLLHSSVAGYVQKKQDGFEFLQAVRSIRSGQAWFDAVVARHRRALTQKQSETPLKALTRREHQVWELIQAGKNNRAIAQDLGVSVHSIRRHNTSIYQKLGVLDRVKAIVEYGVPTRPPVI